MGVYKKATSFYQVKDYQKGISPLLPPRCREYPTCSHRAVEGVGKHGATKGSLMQAGRIMRCQPFVKGGYDLVLSTFSVKRNSKLKIIREEQSNDSKSN
ncbi:MULTISPECIES: membrane protein insertion efficiency factor YidD [Aerococcus]|uniref:Putative membrane protein insertion efficiency factor n=1 Tax=Aerococcus urinaeequi TaxID=51665 RepID=A0ABR5ZXP4_9LACT|nr:membrane protein insertion efficiency factor YidD [Aerococcus urinaeequi]MBA5746517.1 membrane protein insertion efficiency factor YidD [Aerococcus urinaeequi]MBA5829432.1 membrane protein insertion efficiency factor YidD [Aerococcus urinaeequi]MBA5860205.1 membrane protein insertion efficiency factor YidD [Aerococcus urinaeequi]HCU44735.1 membrane protein insertion efficiency factor YidD [Sphingobacterium sp.]